MPKFEMIAQWERREKMGEMSLSRGYFFVTEFLLKPRAKTTPIFTLFNW